MDSDLETYCSSNFPLSLKDRIRIINNISRGLVELHNSNIVHRDLVSFIC